MKLKENSYGHIKNIIFDLGGVLIDIKIERSVEAFLKLGIGGLDVADIHPHQKGFFLEYELGLISDSEFIGKMRKTYNCDKITDDDIWNAWNILLQDIEISRFRLVEKLRENYRIYLLSNTNKTHIDAVKANFRKISQGGEFEECFDRCFYSHTMNLRKPDPAIFSGVLQSAGITAEETLFIDDNDCNFSGAKALGIETIHLVKPYTVSDLFV